ncbi:unnamed protein product, partial [Didymodactylos carnosus]
SLNHVDPRYKTFTKYKLKNHNNNSTPNEHMMKTKTKKLHRVPAISDEIIVNKSLSTFAEKYACDGKYFDSIIDDNNDGIDILRCTHQSDSFLDQSITDLLTFTNPNRVLSESMQVVTSRHSSFNDLKHLSDNSCNLLAPVDDYIYRLENSVKITAAHHHYHISSISKNDENNKSFKEMQIGLLPTADENSDELNQQTFKSIVDDQQLRLKESEQHIYQEISIVHVDPKCMLDDDQKLQVTKSKKQLSRIPVLSPNTTRSTMTVRTCVLNKNDQSKKHDNKQSTSITDLLEEWTKLLPKLKTLLTNTRKIPLRVHVNSDEFHCCKQLLRDIELLSSSWTYIVGNFRSILQFHQQNS